MIWAEPTSLSHETPTFEKQTETTHRLIRHSAILCVQSWSEDREGGKKDQHCLDEF
jgi:hypothetical protein